MKSGRNFLRPFPACHAALTFALLSMCGCASSNRQAVLTEQIPELAAEIDKIPVVDHHAHPVAVVPEGSQDREFDALPVDNMEPASDPLPLRAGNPRVTDAWRALFSYPYNDAAPGHARERQERKHRIIREKGESYPTWVLDQISVGVMLANRVEMGRGIQPPRFLWVPYADALMFPLNNSRLAAKNSDRKAFFADEELLLRRYLKDAGAASPPPGLADYLTRVVTPTLERHRHGGAVAEKFEAAYLRPLEFDMVERASAERIYARYVSKGTPTDIEYRQLQDYLFRYIAAECGRLGMTVHLHMMSGGGSYFDVQGSNPLLFESVLDDPALRKTRFVLVHGGWPFVREACALLQKPNAYLDFSAQSLVLTPATSSQILREWLEFIPEKVMFGTDSYPYSEEMGWEESAWVATRQGREALTRALSGMVRDGEVSRDRALELARMVLRDNARKLYNLPNDSGL